MVQAPQKITTQELANLAVTLIKQAGCEYGDIRLCNYRTQSLSARDRSLMSAVRLYCIENLLNE